MKQKLLLMLKTLFASKGFSQKTIEGIADILSPNLNDASTEEEINTAIAGVTPFAELMQAENTRYANEVKSKLPKAVEVTNPVITPVVEPNPNETSTDRLLRELLEGQKTQALELAALKGEKVTNTRRDSFIKSMYGTSKEYQARELKKFDRITFKDDEDFNSFIDDTKEDHAGAIQEEANSGLGDDRPTGGSGKPVNGEKEVSPAMKELIAERTAKAEAKTAQNI